ncbi:hypothetical protein HK096_007270 [Nowakowskiella sp. JEL0078]|nr:hypothetical protein HK096_007270 [Nowakowskiella sp. JEL0078]
MGVYGDAGTATCAGFPGSLGYETKDANQLASWGIDFLKYDNCNSGTATAEARYTNMSLALQASGRSFYFAMCDWGVDFPWLGWGIKIANSWRVASDISNSFSSVAQIIENAAGNSQYGSPGGWNDYDMLEVGNGGMTQEEEKVSPVIGKRIIEVV